MEYFEMNRKILMIAGMWLPKKTQSFRYKLLFYTYSAIVLTHACILFLISQAIILPEIYSEKAVFLDTLRLVLTMSWGTLKVSIWFYKNKSIFNVLNTLLDHSNIDEIYGDIGHGPLVKKKIFYNHFRSALVTSVSCGVSLGSWIPIVKHLIFNEITFLDDTTLMNNTIANNVQLPHRCWYPFEYRTSRSRFIMALLYQYPILHHAFIIAGFDVFYVAILSYIVLQFDLVKIACSTARGRVLQRLGFDPDAEFIRDPPGIAKETNKELNKITIHLQALIRSCGEMESTFTYLILCQSLFSLGAIAISLLQISAVDLPRENYAHEFFFTSAIVIELFVISYFGTSVTDSALDVPSALFYSEWFSSDMRFKRTLMINMLRMQVPIYFTIGHFQPLSLKTFVSVSKMAYSFCAVVKNSGETK